MQLVVLALESILASHPTRVLVHLDSTGHPISPYIYGRNNTVGGVDRTTGIPNLRLGREAGLRLWRENGGNNATKYNWRNGLSSHPDWYNNVYSNDWDAKARAFADSTEPGDQAFFAFQLLGWAASDKSRNFDDDAYNKSQWWNGVGQNLAGGGTVNPAGGNAATKEGDPARYLQPWPADSTVGILDHWFGGGGLGFDSSRFRYWNMDNEPDIWSLTHDDVATDTMPFETYFQKYLAVALAARAKAPSTKLVGPVFTSEWQWWTWNAHLVKDGASKRSPMEMFLKRIGEEERRTGKRLLDVFDLHFYPGMDGAADTVNAMQLGRFFFDTTYLWPKSNGIHMVDGRWGTPVANYPFRRIRAWMRQHLGEERGLGLSELGNLKAGGDSAVRALAYGGILATFADEGVEMFSPWSWFPEWWEVLHLYSRHYGSSRLPLESDADSSLGIHASTTSSRDTVAVALINTSRSSRTTVVRIGGLGGATLAAARWIELSSFRSGSFRSRTDNALRLSDIAVAGDSVSLAVPARSQGILRIALVKPPATNLSRNPAQPRLRPVPGGFAAAGLHVAVLTPQGRSVRSGEGWVGTEGLRPGVWIVKAGNQMRRFVVE